MSIEKFTDEELEAELNRRRNETENEKESSNLDLHLFIGIIDDEGAESIILANTPQLFVERMNSLQLRARFNSHRNPTVYSVKIPMQLFEEFTRNIRIGKYMEVAETIQKIPTFKSLGF
jgi:hypothetical protein